MIEPAADGAVRSFGVAPARAWDIRPPVAEVIELERVSRPAKYQRAWHQPPRIGARILLGIGRPFGHGAVASRADEAREVLVRHGSDVQPERRDCDALCRRFVAVMMVGSQQDAAAGDRHHVWVVRQTWQKWNAVAVGRRGKSLCRCAHVDLPEPDPPSRVVVSTLGSGVDAIPIWGELPRSAPAAQLGLGPTR